jgi:tyrosyl-tRNA synthetase
MWSYLELLTDRTADVIENLKTNVQAGTTHPKQVKVSLASEIVKGFYGEEAAAKAAAHFQRVFSDRQVPEEMQEIRLQRIADGLSTSIRSHGGIVPLIISGSKKWSQVLTYLKQVESASEAERIIKQGGLEINGSIVKDPITKLDPSRAATYDLRLGKKKFLRIIVE